MGGRIRWLFQTHAYEVLYKDEEGLTHKTSKGLQVSRVDVFGNPLSVEDFHRAREVALDKARALWNELDKSDVGRYIAVEASGFEQGASPAEVLS